MKKNVAILIFDEVEVLDFAGPFEVFSISENADGQSLFNVFTVGLSAAPVRTVGGLRVVPGFSLENGPRPDVLIVPGGIGTRALVGNPALSDWLRARSGEAEIVASVCTGALLLARAGLLDGLRVTTHHNALDYLRRLAPKAVVEPSSRFHDNGKICTAAGISAGIDLSLHLVGRLAGPEVEKATARRMEYEQRA